MSALPQPVMPRFDVLAVVSSAGGLDAITAVLADFPADFAVTVIVGQHLGIDSALVDILSRRLQMRVQWAADGSVLVPGCVHVCPPHMRMEVLPDGSCMLQRLRREILFEKPLDALLRSMADSHGARALAVVLTGMGRDGADGARALKTAGGAVVVQSEATAAFPDMPRSAIEAGAADLVLPLAEIGRTVLDLVAGGRFPQPRNESEAREALFAGSGSARDALREVDWAATPLGPVLRWPQALKAVVATALHSDCPMCILWGEEFVQIYNDAWSAILGHRHPAQGIPARMTWPEHWAESVVDLRHVLQTGEGHTLTNHQVEANRNGFPEEAYYTSSRSPLFDDDGAIGGVLILLTERTPSVLAERRLKVLRSLAASGAEQVSVACQRTAVALAEDPLDVPFSLVYMLDAAGVRASLCACDGLRQGSTSAAQVVDLYGSDGLWPLGKVVRSGRHLVVQGLADRLPAFHNAAWDQAPDAAVLFPLRLAGTEPKAVLVMGLSPRLRIDDDYLGFMTLAAQQVEANLGESHQRERDRARLAELAALDAARTEFFSNVSHEFRTPLTLILGPLEDMLATRRLPVPVHAELEMAMRNANRLLNLVDTLLDFSQIEASRLRASFVPTDLAALTCDVASLFRSAAERAGLTLEVDCPPLEERVLVDASMWEKIISNLLSNALKFTFQGRVTVRLRKLQNHVQLEVSDTGVGIPEEEVPLVMQRFHRVRGTRARTHEGAGIGLSLVDELVRLHHGRMRVRSTVGVGTVFTVWINTALRLKANGADPAAAEPHAHPVARQLAREAERWSSGDAAAAPPEIEESVMGPTSQAAAVHMPGARILVADDNADLRDYLGRALGAYWKVELAANGEDAMSIADRLPPDLVLADVMMPGLDGFALLRALRADRQLKSIPVVLMTARAHEDAAIEGLLAGADDYIGKPFSSRELVARVGAQLALASVRRHGEQQLRELLSLMPVAVCSVDEHARFVFQNRRAVELLGAQPGNEARLQGLLQGWSTPVVRSSTRNSR